MLERRIIAEAHDEKFSLTFFSNYRNYQHWYTIETIYSDAKSYSHDYFDCNEAFDRWEAKVKANKLDEKYYPPNQGVK